MNCRWASHLPGGMAGVARSLHSASKGERGRRRRGPCLRPHSSLVMEWEQKQVGAAWSGLCLLSLPRRLAGTWLGIQQDEGNSLPLGLSLPSCPLASQRPLRSQDGAGVHLTRSSRVFAKQMVCVCAQLCPTLCDPTDCSPPGSSVHGILQERILEWVAISYSRGSS